MPELTVRPYQQEDRPAVHRIAADTAFFGEPVECYMEDRRLFLEAFYAYYTDFEPEHGWVACAGGEVVGFLMGCVDTTAQRRIWIGKLLPEVAWRALWGRYRLGRLTVRYGLRLAAAFLRGEFPHPDLDQYPAHLHINLDTGWRGRGLGRKLLESYLYQLHELNLPGVHLDTTSQNQAACRLYERVGFRLLEARQTRIWSAYFDHPVENRCYGLCL